MYLSLIPKKRSALCPKAKKVEWIDNVVLRKSCHLPTIINRVREAFISSQRSEIKQIAILPQNSPNFRNSSVWIDRSILRESGYVSSFIDCNPSAVSSSWQRSQVSKDAVAPLECVIDLGIVQENWEFFGKERICGGGIGLTCGFATVVQGDDAGAKKARSPAERP